MIDTFDRVVILMHFHYTCKALHIPHIDDKRVLICVVNLSVDALFLYLAQIIGQMISRLWKLALKRLAKSSNCTKKGRCGR